MIKSAIKIRAAMDRESLSEDVTSKVRTEGRKTLSLSECPHSSFSVTLST